VTIINEQTTRLSGRTDEDGRYQTAPIRAGRYRIGFSLPGNLGAVQYVPQKLILEEASFFEVVADQTITVDEQLLATGFIVGRVESTDGRPLAGASVNVLDARHAGAGFTRTGDNGEFRTEVFPGQYRISFSTPDFSRFQYFVGAKTFGKWSVQSLETLPNGYAYKFTLGLFKTPSGKSFEGVGLTPDLEVPMDEVALQKANNAKVDDRLNLDVQLRTATELLAKP